MEYTLDKIEISGEHKHLQIREIIQAPRLDEDGEPVLNDDGKPIIDSGGYHRRVLTPDEDVSGEVQEIQDKAEELWTDKVKTSWNEFQAKLIADAKHLAEQEAQSSNP